jgi:RNA-directed DNA polymerase
MNKTDNKLDTSEDHARKQIPCEAITHNDNVVSNTAPDKRCQEDDVITAASVIEGLLCLDAECGNTTNCIKHSKSNVKPGCKCKNDLQVSRSSESDSPLDIIDERGKSKSRDIRTSSTQLTTGEEKCPDGNEVSHRKACNEEIPGKLQPVTGKGKLKCQPILPIPMLPCNIFSRMTTKRAIAKAFDRLLRDEGSLKIALGLATEDSRQGKRKAKGIDGKTLIRTYHEYQKNPTVIVKQLKCGEYKPTPVKRIYIPKQSGGKRPLGIPTFYDRAVQTAILKEIEPLIEPYFSKNSHGFRPGKSVFTAAAEVREYQSKYQFVISIDIAKFFDELNHTKLMEIIRNVCEDDQLNRLIEDFLKAGVFEDGKVVRTVKGSPQGGVISPLLANLYLHELDRELTRRKLDFTRYADDLIIYANSERSAKRIFKSITCFINDCLALRVNVSKSSIKPIYELSFLGLSFPEDGIRVGVAKLDDFKSYLRRITYNPKGVMEYEVIQKLKRHINGWFAHYGRIDSNIQITAIGSWMKELIRQRVQTGNSFAKSVLEVWNSNVSRRSNWDRAINVVIQ